MKRKAISENKLVIPALAVLSQQNDFISTKELKRGILSIIKPKKADLEPMTDRDQPIIESRIENLVSHRTLEGFVDHEKIGSKIYVRINGKGKTLLSKKLLAVD